MRLNEFLKWFWDRLWLFALAGLVVGGATYVVVARRPPAYEARVMMVVGGYMQAPNPDTTEIRTGVELARTYAVLATTHDVLREAVAAADFPLAPDRLAELVDTEVRSDTSILELSVTYTDAEQAATIANAIAQQLIVQSPTNLTPEQQQQLDMAYAQIDRLNRQLERARAEVDALDQSLADEGATADLEPFERTLLLEQQERLTNQINQLTASLAEFLAVAAGMQERTNALEIVEWARTPPTPVNTNTWVITLFGAMVGVVLIAGLVFIVEYLDDTIWVPDAAAQTLGLPVLAVIPEIRRRQRQPGSAPHRREASD
ncbi:MAG: hypothetical protein M5R40_21825 [Anaerolineae bacterium]|nr:hypothetical protein [Anaerolineae bacterium]